MNELFFLFQILFQHSTLAPRDESLDELAQRRGSLNDAQRRRLERGRGLLQTWLLAFIIVLYFVYPNLIQVCIPFSSFLRIIIFHQESSQMLRCIPIHWVNDVPHPDVGHKNKPSYSPGSGVTEKYLQIDLGINCGDTEYQYYKMLAIIFAMTYGIGIPLLAVAIVRVAILRKNFESAKRAFGFLVMGYREDKWYWEAIVMMRKLAVVFIVVFIEDSKLQTYVGMWVMSFALVVHLWARPYDSNVLINLEAFSLSIIIATLNFSLLYHWDLEEIYETALTIMLAVGTLAVFVLFLYFLGIEGVKKAMVFINKIREQLAKRAEKAGTRLSFAVGRVLRSDSTLEVLDEDQKKLAGTRVVTHASTLPNFDRLTLLSKLFVLRGGMQEEDEDYEEEEDEGSEDNQDTFANPSKWKGAGIVAGNTLGGKLISHQNSVSQNGPEAPQKAPPARLQDKLMKHRDNENLYDEVTDDIIENIKNDMEVGDNTRFTRQQAKNEALEGYVLNAAYMYCHLKNEGASSGISDKEAQRHIGDMEWGMKHAREYCCKGRNIDTEEFIQIWNEEIRQYVI